MVTPAAGRSSDGSPRSRARWARRRAEPCRSGPCACRSCAVKCPMPTLRQACTVVAWWARRRSCAPPPSAPAMISRKGTRTDLAPASVNASSIRSTANCDNGTRWGLPFFVRQPGRDHVRAARSISSRRMPDTSPTRWAVTRQILMIIWHVLDFARAAGRPSQSVRTSSSDRTRSRGVSEPGARPSMGLRSRSPRATAQRNMARRS